MRTQIGLGSLRLVSMLYTSATGVPARISQGLGSVARLSLRRGSGKFSPAGECAVECLQQAACLARMQMLYIQY